MMDFLKKMPAFFLFLILSIVYLACGYMIGYYIGYTNGQQDYENYLNELTK
jgi:hypothetical protein